MLIDTTDEKTFPTAIKSIIFEYLSGLTKEIENRILENRVNYSIDARCAVEDYLSPFKAPGLFEKIIAVLNDCNIISYHATKVLDIASIKNNGLHTNTWEWYGKFFENSLKTLLFDDSTIRSALDLIYREYKRKYTNHDRTAQICFFSGIRLFESEDDSVGFDRFCENIGGELARWALEDKMPSVYSELKHNGISVVVKVSLPFKDVASYLRESIAYQFVCYYASEYFWNFEYKIDYDCITEKDILPNQIIDIIPYEKCNEGGMNL